MLWSCFGFVLIRCGLFHAYPKHAFVIQVTRASNSAEKNINLNLLTRRQRASSTFKIMMFLSNSNCIECLIVYTDIKHGWKTKKTFRYRAMVGVAVSDFQFKKAIESFDFSIWFSAGFFPFSLSLSSIRSVFPTPLHRRSSDVHS